MIETESFHTNLAQGQHTWEPTNSPAGFSGRGTMYALPNLTNPDTVLSVFDAMTLGPRLDYRIQFTETGTHYLWVRGSDGGGDSVHAGFDEDDPAGTNLDNIDAPGCCGTRGPGGVSLVWINGTGGSFAERATFEVLTTGEHTVHLWMREDGMIVDKMIITTDPNFAPSGAGPAESVRVGQAQPPIITSITPATAAAGVPVDANIEFVVTHGTFALDTNSIQLTVNSAAVTPSATTSANQTTILFDSPTNFSFSSRINIQLIVSDTTSPRNTLTNATYFTTTRPASTLPPIRQDASGLIVIEAENFDVHTSQGSHQWLFDKTPPGFSGDGTLYALPNLTNPDTVIEATEAQTLSPRLDYKIQFTQTGTHYLWVRGSDGGGDSIHAGINGQDPLATFPTLAAIDEPGCCGDRLVPGGSSLVWIGANGTTPEDRSQFEITQAGLITLNLWMREDGQIVDKIVITQDPNFVPAGAGPAESPRVGDPFRPLVKFTSPTNDQAFAANAPITLRVDASDPDGSIAKVEFFLGETKIGEDTTGPDFSFTFAPTEERALTFSARATDNTGLTAEAGAVRVISGNPPAILFVGNNPRGNAGDLFAIERLEARNFLVTAVDDNDSDPSQATGKVLIVISSTTSSGNVNIKFTDATIPIINWEEALFDDLIMTGDSGADPDHHGTTGGQTTVDILNPNHPLAAGLPAGPQVVSSSPQTFTWGDPDTNRGNSIAVASMSGNTNRLAVWAYEKGVILFDGATPAPARRVGIFFNADSTLALNAAGQALLEAAINWALDIKVTPPTKLNIAQQGANAVISWTGQGTLQQADSVTGPFSNAPSQGNPQTINIEGAMKFFRVRQ